VGDIMMRLQQAGETTESTVSALTDLVEMLRYLDHQSTLSSLPPLDGFALTTVTVDTARVARRLRNEPHALAGACEALAVISKLCSGSYDLRGMLAGDLGCMQLLIEATDAYPYGEHADLHEPAAEALYYLTFNHQDNAALFAGMRGIPVLIKAMRDPYGIQNVGYQLRACGILRNLARWPETHPGLQASGGLHALADALRSHPDHDGIRQAAYSAFGMLSARAVGS
jgi:hypothetical protein